MRKCYHCGRLFTDATAGCQRCGVAFTALDRVQLWRRLRRFRHRKALRASARQQHPVAYAVRPLRVVASLLVLSLLLVIGTTFVLHHVVATPGSAASRTESGSAVSRTESGSAASRTATPVRQQRPRAAQGSVLTLATLREAAYRAYERQRADRANATVLYSIEAAVVTFSGSIDPGPAFIATAFLTPART